jgi:hypothetical protein
VKHQGLLESLLAAYAQETLKALLLAPIPPFAEAEWSG